MKYNPKQLATRSFHRVRTTVARLDRCTRWTLVPLVAFIVIALPLWSAAIRLHFFVAARPAPVRVPILVYHSIVPAHPGQSPAQRLLNVDTATFRQQMTYLAANKVTVVGLDAVIDALQGHGSVPARSVVITFDDGWLSQYVHALPLLQQMHYTATFFIVTSQVGKGTMYMDLDELKALQKAGMTLASHTRTHPDLCKMSDAQLRDEVVGSRQDLQKMLGISTDLFAYPYGAWNKRVVDIVSGAGYRAARALGGGGSNDVSDRYMLHSVLATDDMAAFERDVSGPILTSAPAPSPAEQSGL
jgi:peptidoglycan/xylan/chitin deacetylase (PgdA/CDA1 family)